MRVADGKDSTPQTRGVEALKNAVAGGKKFKSSGDWITQILDRHGTIEVEGKKRTVKVKDAEGNEREKVVTGTSKRVVDVQKVVDLANANGHMAKTYPNSGMYRMNVGNMLRAGARKRGGVYIGTKWHTAPDEFLGPNFEPTENRKGEKLKKEAAEQKKAA